MDPLTYPRRAIEADGTVHAARFTGPRTFTTACHVYPAPAAERLDASHATPVTCTGCRAALAGFTRQPYRGNCDSCRAYWDTCQDLGEQYYAATPADQPPLSNQIARALAMYGEHAISHIATA